MMKTLRLAGACGAAMLLIAGCKKTADNTSNYKSAIDGYYSAHPACLWDTTQKFPVQVGASDNSKTSQYDALYDQGLLTRTTGEKKVMIIASKQVTNYDLSDKGRGAWTADTSQPGYGNFCYGHRSVSSIDSSTPNSGQPGATTQVSYHYSFSGAPGWAQAAETQNAFPEVKTDLAGNGVANANLEDTGNGWQLQAPAGRSSHPVTGADGRVVE